MAPEVFLKALAMVRNVAHQEGRGSTFHHCRVRPGAHSRRLSEGTARTDPGYYFRPHKTILVRTVADGGESFYFQGEHRATLPALRRRYRKVDERSAEILAAFPRARRWWWAISAWTAGAPTIPAQRTLRVKPAFRDIGVVSTEITPGAGGTVGQQLG